MAHSNYSYETSLNNHHGQQKGEEQKIEEQRFGSMEVEEHQKKEGFPSTPPTSTPDVP